LTFREIIDLWSTRSLLAQECGVDPGLVRTWYALGYIPSRRWNAVVASAQKYGLTQVTHAALNEAAKAKREARNA
jgi:hypothetical protein